MKGAVEPLFVSCPFRLREASTPKFTIPAVVGSIVITVGAAFAEVDTKVETNGTNGSKEMLNARTTARETRLCPKRIVKLSELNWP